MGERKRKGEGDEEVGYLLSLFVSCWREEVVSKKKGEYSVGEVEGRAGELLLCCVCVIKARFITSSLRVVPVLVDEPSPSDEYSKKRNRAGWEGE